MRIMTEIIEKNSELATYEAGIAAVVTREQTEIQGRMALAQKFKRDEQKAFSKTLNSMSRPAMAEAAEYSFPRGGKAVSGPSVDLARELARCYGNISYGLRIVSCDDVKVHIRGYALDLESNAHAEAEDIFKPLIQRKNRHTGETEWITPDERDLRELINRRGAICVRNALLSILPPDFIEGAREKARETLKRSAAGKLQENKEDTLRKLIVSFSKFGVEKEMLEEFLGHELALIDGDELAELQRIWRSINDRHTKPHEHFSLEGNKNKVNSEQSLKEKLGAKAKAVKVASGEVVNISDTNETPGMYE